MISPLTLEGMVEQLRNAISSFPDTRKSNRSYAMEDAVLGAFSVFFTQCPSFLAHQRAMQQQRGKNNAASLFGIKRIPTDPQIRNILDPIGEEYLFPVFDTYLWTLRKQGFLDQFRVSTGDLLIALDGTWTVSSDKIHCRKCLTVTHKGKTTYYHSMLTPVIVAPGNPHVLSLSPEHIIPQDGKEKQDCENAAAKRWIAGCGKRYAPLNVTVAGDDLYSRQPIMQELLDAGFHFILVCKRESHSYLYDWIDTLQEAGDMQTVVKKRWTGKYHEIDTYRFANDVPVRDGDDALRVGWCDLRTIREEDGKQKYYNAFILDREITADNVAEIVLQGRTRWKVENESNNTLKTKGYHLEHNYGHGEKHLANFLSTCTLLSFLFHTILDLCNETYRKVRNMLPSRITFFNDLRALTRYWYYTSWDGLLAFMLKGLKERIPAPG